MKTQNTIVTAILCVAIVVLFVLHFTGRKDSSAPVAVVTNADSAVVLPIAYVNLDSVLTNYSYAQDLNDKLMRSTESAQATLNQKGRNLESEMQEFKRKVDNNAFFDRERAEKEQQRILQKQDEFNKLNQKLTIELQQQQAETNRILRDTIMVNIKSFNAQHKYQMIFSNAMNDNILYADKVYDATGDFISYLNKKYVPESK